MSKTAVRHKQNSDHGQLNSYITGFALSLICTFIPYYLVVEQSFTGNALLFTILGFAVAQLVIQLTFFLHLGRGPKPNWNLFFFGSTMTIVLVVVGGSIFIINNLLYNMSPSEQSIKLIEDQGIYQIEGKETGACYGQHETHKVYIKDGKPNPLYTYANECDTLIFINEDNGLREIAFGEHPDHDIYAGEDLLIVTNRRSNSVVLSEVGFYKYHDHLDPDTNGFFVVEPKQE